VNLVEVIPLHQLNYYVVLQQAKKNLRCVKYTLISFASYSSIGGVFPYYLMNTELFRYCEKRKWIGWSGF
jgi:hypothetical protein